MSAFTMEVTHLANNGCDAQVGDRSATRWSEVTCATCMATMPGTADNGCAHERMVDYGAPRVAGFDARPWVRNYGCVCGFREERWATAEQMLAEGVSLTGVVNVLCLAAEQPSKVR